MNITLIRPPAYSRGLMGAQRVPFLGITYIAAAVREAGYDVDVIDMCAEAIEHTEVIREKHVAYGMPFSALAQRIKASEIIGFTCTFSQDWVFNRELINYVGRIFPDTMMVAGGEHVSAVPEYCLNDCPELDVCILGEGEEIFVKLLNAIKNNQRLSGIPGVVFRSSDKSAYCYTGRPSRIRDIDKLAQPAWDLIPLENYLSRELNYHIRRGRTMPMLATRGCPYKCSFCSNANMWGIPWIARSPEKVVDEMEYYIRRYQANNFVFSDLTAVVDREPLVELCNEILRRKLNLTWQLPTLRTEALDREVLELMYRAGCRELDFAIESGSRTVLGSVNKKNDPQKIISLIKEALDVGMNLSINIVIGLPKEGVKDFIKTSWMVLKLAIIGLQEINVFPFIPYPGSRLFAELSEKKTIVLNDEFFFSLFGYADLGEAVSWSEKFGPRTLKFMRLGLMSAFYSTMFICHPNRLIRLMINAVRGKPATKLENVVSRVFKNISVYISYKKRYAGQNI